MDAVSLVQARMGSSRLPGKVLLPLGDACVLDQVVARTREFSVFTMVCTSVSPDDDAIADHCVRQGIPVVRGSLNDVYARFHAALLDERVPTSAYFVRVTGDSPLLCPDLARYLMGFCKGGVDYVAPDHATIPLGIGCEVVKRAAFLSLNPATLDGPEREHVTLALYDGGRGFQARRVPAPAPYRAPELRLTLDYPEDYELIQRIYRELPGIRTEELISALRGRPDWVALNSGCTQKSAR